MEKLFNLNQIHLAFSKVKGGADFPRYVQDLKSIGVTHYDNYVSDGRTKYYGSEGYSIEGEPKYPEMEVSEWGSADKLKHALLIHQHGQTDYPTFCRQAAEAGVEKWITHMIEMTVTYTDKSGKILVAETIPAP